MTNPNILREIGLYRDARLNQKIKLDDAIKGHNKNPSAHPLQNVYGEAIKSLGIKWWLVDHTIGADKKKEERVRAVEGIAIYLNETLDEHISKSGILDELLNAQRTLTEETERRVGDNEPIVMTPATLRSIGRLVIQLAKTVKERETTQVLDVKEIINTEGKARKKDKAKGHEPEKIRSKKHIVIIVTDGEDKKVSSVIVGTREIPMEQVDQAVLYALATAKDQTLTVPELYRIIVAHADPNEELQPNPSYLDMSSRVNRTINVIRGNRTINIQSHKVRGVSVAKPSSYSLIDVDCKILTENEAKKIEEQRRVKNMQALNDVLNVLEGTNQRSIHEILKAMPPSRAHKQPLNQHAYLAFSALIGHAANPKRSSSELDDSDRALLNRVIKYMESHTNIRNLSEFVSALALAVGGIKPEANHSKVINKELTLERLKEIRNQRHRQTHEGVKDERSTNSILQDEELLFGRGLNRGKIKKTITRIIHMFPVTGRDVDHALKTSRRMLKDMFTGNADRDKKDLAFVQALVNNRIFFPISGITHGRVTEDLLLLRREMVYILHLKMQEHNEKANIMKLPKDLQNALMRVIEHDLPGVVKDLNATSPDRVKALSMSQIER